MISRRQFLVTGLGALGGWLVGTEAARHIVRLAEDREAYLVDIDNPTHELWATYCCDEYIFTLGCSYSAMELPRLTWREWLEVKDVDISRPKDIREFLKDWGWYRPEKGGLYVPPCLDDPLPEELLQNYHDWEYSIRDAPTARAFRYLQGLRLANREVSGEPLGSLEFVEGPCPGNNASLVSARSIETLGGLQQRLLELGERVRIHEDMV